MANKLLTANQKTVNFKMYKHGKQWLFASATALALALAGTTVTAHADTTAATTTTGAAGGKGQSAQVTQPATQNQAGAGAADTITTYPHKDVIDNAVKGAQGTEGLEIIKDNDQTIKADNQADAAQQIEKDYNSQVQDIKDAQTRVEKGRHQQSNYQTYNNMHGDTSSLDQAVQNAKGIPGLNVVKDADNKSSFSSDDDDALAKWGTVTQKEYQSEVDAINKAVDTQKQNNNDYERALDVLTSDQHQIIDSTWEWHDPIHQNVKFGIMPYHIDITWHYDKTQQAVIVTNVDITISRKEPNTHGGGFWDTLVFVNPNYYNDLPQEQGSYRLNQGDLPGVNADSLWQMLGNRPGVQAFYTNNNKTEAYSIRYNHNNSVPYKARYLGNGKYDLLDLLQRNNDMGKDIQHIMWQSAQSPVTINLPTLKTTEAHYHYNTAIVTPPTQPTHETVHYHYDAYNYTPNAQKHFVDHGQISDNKVYADGSAITAQIDSTLPDAANFPDGLKSVVLDEDYSNYAKYVTSGDVSKVKITDHSNNSDVTNDFTITDDGQGHMTITLKDPSKAKGQTIRVTPSWTINKDVADQTALKNVAMLVVNGVKGDPATATVTTYNAKPHKDVELGDNVQGDTPNSIAGQTVPAGTVVTFPLSSNDLPANREQDVVTVVWSDTLDDNLDYQSYKAYLPDANGQLIDVTDHVKLDQNGKNLKFTWDDYLIQLANENKASAFKKPVIDLVAKVNGNSIVATNKFDEAMTFKDLTGNQTNVDVTSNEVSVKTPDAPKPQKEDLNDQGQNIDGQEVTAGQHITYQLDWNFINDKGITASTGDIAKGFFFADPIDSNALEAGDLSTAQVIDENGNKVSGVSIKLYNSLSEAPELFQQEVKENGLTDKFSHGPFFLASADDPQDFFTKYVSAGKSLKVDIPTVVKDGYNGTFSNTAWQFEFGKATPTNTVTNTVKPSPKPAPKPAPTPVSTPRPASPAPAAPAAPQAALPQTGNNNNTAVIGLAIAGLAASMSLAGLGLRKKN